MYPKEAAKRSATTVARPMPVFYPSSGPGRSAPRPADHGGRRSWCPYFEPRLHLRFSHDTGRSVLTVEKTRTRFEQRFVPAPPLDEADAFLGRESRPVRLLTWTPRKGLERRRRRRKSAIPAPEPAAAAHAAVERTIARHSPHPRKTPAAGPRGSVSVGSGSGRD